MKVELRKESPSRAVLEIELPPEEVARGVDRALARLNQRVEIPGFRRGKAPKVLLQRYVGREAVYEEAVKELVPDAYTSAVDQAGVKPIARPQINVDTVEEGKPLRFVATVDLVPEISLGDYRAIRIQQERPEVTDADVDTAVEDLRRRHAHLAPVGGRAAERGDFVLMKVVEVTGEHDRLGVGKDYLVEIGGAAYPQALEEALVGVGPGARHTVTLGPEAGVTVEVVDVKRRELPEVTDEFAKNAASAGSVQELRDTMRERMTGEVTARAQQAHEQQVVDALLDGAAIEVPASLVEHELQHLAGDLAETLQRRGVTLQRYLEATEKTEGQLLDELRPGAERRVRTQLAIEEIARLEGLQPTGEEIDREVENVARRLQQDLPRVREWLAQLGRYDALVGALRRQKALDFLVKIARGDPSISTQGHPEPSREGDVA